IAMAQLSLTVGRPKSTFVARQRPGLEFTLTSTGLRREGALVSETTTKLGLVAVLPEESKAVKTTMFVPGDRRVSAGGDWVTVTELQLSIATIKLVPVRSGSAARQLPVTSRVRLVKA